MEDRRRERRAISKARAPRDESYWRYGLGLGALIVALAVFNAGSKRLKPGASAPDFELPRVDEAGQTLRLSSLRGTPVVLEVFASWCRICRDAAPRLARAARAERPIRIQFIGMSLDESAETARRTAESWGLPYPVVHDRGEVARRYGVSVLPTLVLIDAEGAIHEIRSGAPDWDALESALARLGGDRKSLGSRPPFGPEVRVVTGPHSSLAGTWGLEPDQPGPSRPGGAAPVGAGL